MALLGCILTFLIFFFLLYWVFLKYKKGLLMITFTMLSKIPFFKKKDRCIYRETKGKSAGNRPAHY